MKRYDLIIFDLDGTLANTSSGIYECYRYTLDKMGKPAPTKKDFEGIIGGVPLNLFQTRFHLTLDEAKQAVVLYRQHYAKVGFKGAYLYDGLKDTLQYLKTRGYKLAVATLKAENLATDFLQHFGILDIFDIVHGANIDDSLSKSDLINLCISVAGSDMAHSVLVGDSLNDAEGAHKSNIDFVAALYGFGFSVDKDLDAISCVASIKSPLDLKDML